MTYSAEFWKRLMKYSLMLSSNSGAASATILATLEAICRDEENL